MLWTGNTSQLKGCQGISLIVHRSARLLSVCHFFFFAVRLGGHLGFKRIKSAWEAGERVQGSGEKNISLVPSRPGRFQTSSTHSHSVNWPGDLLPLQTPTPTPSVHKKPRRPPSTAALDHDDLTKK